MNLIYVPAEYRRTFVHGETWDAQQINAALDYIQTLEDRMSRPKDQDQDQPVTPTGTQTRLIGWDNHRPTVQELRNWIDQLPNHAELLIYCGPANDGESVSLTATWEIT